MSDALSLRLRVYSNPVQVEGPLGQRVCPKAGVAQQVTIILGDQEEVATEFAVPQVSVP